jgi:DeoR/GlpR family transcriptional regulator of sugar metabolism
LQLIEERVSMSVQELSKHFDVSPMTIRRDLALLDEKGLVVRIHGGATAPETPVASREEVRGALHVVQKAAIGAAAANLVEDGQTLFIDAGTTTIELARRLCERRRLTVVTNSVRILAALADSPGINLIGLGGSIYGGAWSFVGPLAEAALRRFNGDIAFMGITSVSLEHGLTEVNFFEATIKSTMIQRARRVVLLADHSKFEKVSPVSVVSIKDLDMLITDEGLSPQLIAAYRGAGVNLFVASAG